MNQNDEREAFEARFPVPDGMVTWNGTGYEVVERFMDSYRADRYCGQWIAWRARAALASQRAEVPQGKCVGTPCQCWTADQRAVCAYWHAAAPPSPPAEQQGSGDYKTYVATKCHRCGWPLNAHDDGEPCGHAAEQPRQMVALTDEQMTALVLPITHDAPSTYEAFCYESGPYSITKLRSSVIALVRAVERAHGIVPQQGEG